MSGQIPHIRIVPHIVDLNKSLYFPIIETDVPEGTILKIGRFTEKAHSPLRIAFKSKVVSRCHAELWSTNGQYFIRDIKSSSGTFLNNLRLSPPGCESKPYLLKDGDIVQLGVDYQGGYEEVYRCVRMKFEFNHHGKMKMENALKTLKSLTVDCESGDNCRKEECCICLYPLSQLQALFVAPCSHAFHFKCVRFMVATKPGFLCPLCRHFADLDADVTVDDPFPLPTSCEQEMALSKTFKADEFIHMASAEHLPSNESNGNSSHSSDVDLCDIGIGSSTQPLVINTTRVDHANETYPLDSPEEDDQVMPLSSTPTSPSQLSPRGSGLVRRMSASSKSETVKSALTSLFRSRKPSVSQN
ncbi:hypothetical protein K493DRAFT_206156 [Basidiobolus meristosporus CBS 931.73]|uniref:SMAD/FHA domain-containing protein n=1 Tax=Basidiobolus meristosporus CBS 931.73 TaxID=1314790 RepID=A0A1Y1Z2L0_9FUNG|nr:hypothetical protein K493DRAFT_206156 [Basidiobolus meristosporus CBS 931.73]|eukprot:ORY04177.1 hypothetical protein K493DRAFT_206156 [Basidiobolus meristosporus CBS 931.73]